MPTSSNELLDTFDRPTAKEMPLHQVEEMLDQQEFDEAFAAMATQSGWLRMGHLLWS